jgi:hypothetical protein
VVLEFTLTLGGHRRIDVPRGSRRIRCSWLVQPIARVQVGLRQGKMHVLSSRSSHTREAGGQ